MRLVLVLAAALLLAAPAAATTVRPSGSRYGTILVDGRGHTLYGFTKDGRGPSTCFGDCARAWPPLYAHGKPRARGGARGRLLGTVKRGSRRQVTYRGRPLYFYVA